MPPEDVECLSSMWIMIGFIVLQIHVLIISLRLMSTGKHNQIPGLSSEDLRNRVSPLCLWK